MRAVVVESLLVALVLAGFAALFVARGELVGVVVAVLGALACSGLAIAVGTAHAKEA